MISAASTRMMVGDDELDLFVFLGTPKEILDEYTKLTGKSPLPPLWSFGLWMSRCTYNAEKQVRDIAAQAARKQNSLRRAAPGHRLV